MDAVTCGANSQAKKIKNPRLKFRHWCLRLFWISYHELSKGFFRVPIQRLRDVVAEKSLEATFTMTADAREYRETQALEKMTPEERQKYHLRESEADAAAE